MFFVSRRKDTYQKEHGFILCSSCVLRFEDESVLQNHFDVSLYPVKYPPDMRRNDILHTVAVKGQHLVAR